MATIASDGHKLISDDEIAAMKVKHLKAALKKRKLDQKGKKAVLQTRLREYMEEMREGMSEPEPERNEDKYLSDGEDDESKKVTEEDEQVTEEPKKDENLEEAEGAVESEIQTENVEEVENPAETDQTVEKDAENAEMEEEEEEKPAEENEEEENPEEAQTETKEPESVVKEPESVVNEDKDKVKESDNSSPTGEKRPWTHMDEQGNFHNGDEKDVSEQPAKKQKTEPKVVLAQSVSKSEIYHALKNMSKQERTKMLMKTFKENPKLFDEIKKQLNSTRSMCKLFIRGLTPVITEDWLTQVYGRYGELLEVRILRDKNGMSKNIGFIIYKDYTGAMKALERPERSFNDRILHINLACKPNKMNMNHRNNYDRSDGYNRSGNYYKPY